MKGGKSSAIFVQFPCNKSARCLQKTCKNAEPKLICGGTTRLEHNRIHLAQPVDSLLPDIGDGSDADFHLHCYIGNLLVVSVSEVEYLLLPFCEEGDVVFQTLHSLLIGEILRKNLLSCALAARFRLLTRRFTTDGFCIVGSPFPLSPEIPSRHSNS